MGSDANRGEGALEGGNEGVERGVGVGLVCMGEDDCWGCGTGTDGVGESGCHFCDCLSIRGVGIWTFEGVLSSRYLFTSGGITP